MKTRKLVNYFELDKVEKRGVNTRYNTLTIKKSLGKSGVVRYRLHHNKFIINTYETLKEAQENWVYLIEKYRYSEAHDQVMSWPV